MKTFPRTTTIGEMWETGGFPARFWIISPFLFLLSVLGSLMVSALTNNMLWFLYGYPLGIVIFVISNALYKRMTPLEEKCSSDTT